MGKFVWSQNKEKAAWLVCEGRLTIKEISNEAKVTEQTIYNWKRQPLFIEKVESILTHIHRTTKTNHARVESIAVRSLIERLQSPGVKIDYLIKLIEIYLPMKIDFTKRTSESELSDEELRKQFRVMTEEVKRERARREPSLAP